MPLHPTWSDIALRLVLTLIAGAVIGLNRGVHGHAAGLRTTILVALAAAVAMIQANLLLGVEGKTPSSFGVMDLMRLPLGILTGVGFIGGGSILKRGDLITGVTTAATLWTVTVIGLCLGGGQIWLGLAAAVISVVTLSGLKWLDLHMPRERRAMLVTKAPAADGSAARRVAEVLSPLGFGVHFLQESVDERDAGISCFRHEIRWKHTEASGPPADLLALLHERFAVISFEMRREDG